MLTATAGAHLFFGAESCSDVGVALCNELCGLAVHLLSHMGTGQLRPAEFEATLVRLLLLA